MTSIISAVATSLTLNDFHRSGNAFKGPISRD